MAIKTKEEIMEQVKTMIGDSTEDSTLEFLGDLTDTLNDFETRSGEDWKKKFEENDQMWKKKYRDRFFSGSSDEPDPDDEEGKMKKYTFENLFK